MTCERWAQRTGKLEFQSLADSILAHLARTTVRQTLTAPLAGALQGAFAGGGLFASYAALERDARAAKAGIWAAGDPERPADYRARIGRQAALLDPAHREPAGTMP